MNGIVRVEDIIPKAELTPRRGSAGVTLSEFSLSAVLRVLIRLVVCALVCGLPSAPAWSQACQPGACGGDDARACTVFERIPSCNPNLVELGGCCKHPNCGREGEATCKVLTRLQACDLGLKESGGLCVQPSPCGKENERVCMLWEPPGGCETNLVNNGGICRHPNCGREAEFACTVLVRIPSCDVGLVERVGRCALPTPCGDLNQRVCPVWERPTNPGCNANLIDSAGICVHPPCGKESEKACPILVRIPSCDTGLVEVAGTCRHPACGTEGSRPCSVFERLPSCDAGLIEMPFGVSCVHPNCGRLNQNACLVTERIPSCDGDLVESGGLCLSASPCELPESAVAVTPPSLQFQAPVTAKTRPQGLVATRVDTKVVRLTWQGDVGGTLSILRDGKLLANLAGNATSYEDPNVSQGWHEYLVKRVPASGPTQPAKVRIRLGPFNVVVLGDSVAWGQGLAEGHKFSNLVARALEAELGTPVRVVVTAHSGANVRPPVGWSLGDEERLTPGEMPNTYPTIQRQIDLAAARFAPNAPVDLVLVDGCINDLGVMTILNPTHSANKIQSDTSTVCGLPVVQLLQGVGTRFPSARIVMTGYFPMVSNASDLTAVGALLATVGVAAGAGSAALGIPVLNPTTGAIVGVGITEATHKLAAMNAQAFHVTSTRTLAQSARTANLSLGGRVSFACTPFSPANAYAAPQTWLWLAPTGGTTNDEVTLSRHQDCARDDYLALAGAPIGSMAPSRLNCMAASIGHPNLLGAKAYANAIQKEINPFLPYWKALFSAVQPKP